MRILAVMPAAGRVEVTIPLLSRLRNTAGMDFELVLVVTRGDPLAAELGRYDTAECCAVIEQDDYAGYWRAMRDGCRGRDFDLVANLANDILPGYHWLKRAVAFYVRHFGSGKDGLVGFNDGIHQSKYGGHFMVSRDLLRSYYGNDLWPVIYAHAGGDAEVWGRAINDGLAITAPWAVLYHNHPLTGADGDAVYDGNDARSEGSDELYQARMRVLT